MASTTKTTVRDHLQTFGGYECILDPSRLMDRPVRRAYCCVAEDGRPFVRCGGDVLFGFEHDGVGRVRYYLVLDSEETRRWDAAHGRNGLDGPKTVMELGPRPSPTFKLVESA